MPSPNAHLRFLGGKRLGGGIIQYEFRLGCEHLGRKTDGSSERSWTFCKEFGETSGKAQFLGAWEMGLDGMFFPAQSLEKSVDVIKIL